MSRKQECPISSCTYCTQLICLVIALAWVHRDIMHNSVRQSLFAVVDGVCKWKHHTLLTSSMSKCWSVKNIVCTTVPRLCCREKENTRLSLTTCFSLPQVSQPLLSVIQLYLCLKMATLPKHTQWGICTVAQPPADFCKCLPLLQQHQPCTAVGGAQFKRSEPLGQ